MADEEVQRAMLFAAVEWTGESEQYLPQQHAQAANLPGSAPLSFDPSSAFLDVHSADWVSEAYQAFCGQHPAESAPSSCSSNAAFLTSRRNSHSDRCDSLCQAPSGHPNWCYEQSSTDGNLPNTNTAETNALQIPAASFSSLASSSSISPLERIPAASAALYQQLSQPQPLSGLSNDYVGSFLDKIQPRPLTGTGVFNTQNTLQPGPNDSERQVSTVPQVACSGIGPVRPAVSVQQGIQLQLRPVSEARDPCSTAAGPRTLTSQDIPLTLDLWPPVPPAAGENFYHI